LFLNGNRLDIVESPKLNPISNKQFSSQGNKMLNLLGLLPLVVFVFMIWFFTEF